MKKIVLLFLAIFFANALTLDDAIQATFKNHPNIKLFLAKVQRANLQKKLVSSTNYPSLSLQTQHAFNQTFLSPKQNTIDTSSNEATIALKQKMYDFAKTKNQIQAANIDTKIAKISLQKAKALLALNVKRLYKLLVLEKKAIAVRKKDVKTKKSYVAQAKALLKQGLKTPADVSRFEAAYIEALDALQREKATFEKAKTTLSLYMGQDLPETLTLQEDIFHKSITISKNYTKSFALQIAKLSIEKQKKLFLASKKRHFGQIDLQAAISRIDALTSYNSKNIFISYVLPLFDKTLDTDTQIAKINILEANKQKEQTLLQTKNKIASLLIDIKSFVTTIKAKEAQIQWAKRSLEVIRARYKEGLSNYLELLDSDTLLLHARLSLLQTLYQKSLLIDELRYLEGKL